MKENIIGNIVAMKSVIYQTKGLTYNSVSDKAVLEGLPPKILQKILETLEPIYMNSKEVLKARVKDDE